MNKRLFLTSALSLVLALSMVFGATFALFTSESKTDITVSSGTVDVNAAITLDSVYSPTTLDMNGVITDANNAAIDAETFYNKGNVTVKDGEITLTNMTPGDKAIFKVTMTNDSNVSLLQRFEMHCEDADKAFFNELIFGVTDAEGNYTYYSDLVTAWETNTAIYGEGTEAVRYLSIEMPGHVKNKWQGKTCNVSVNVKAVQGNADVAADLGTASVVHMVADQATLDTALANAADGDTIYVTAPVDALTVAYTETKTLTIRGYKVNTMTVEAPNATVHVYNDMDTLVGNAVAHHSLYVYGEVTNVDINVGRVIVAADAVVDTLTVKANEGEKVTVEVPAVTSVVREIIVEGKADSEIQVNVSKAVETAPAVTESDANEGTLTEVKFDKAPAGVAELIAAIESAQDGDVIVLTQDIVFTDVNGTSGTLTPLLTITKDITLDMNGMTMSIDADVAAAGITGMPCFIAIADGAEVVLKNGTIDTEAGSNSVYGIDILDGKLTIESGNYYGAFTAVQVKKGELVIKGGTFALSDTYASYNHANIKYMINCVDANYNNGTAVVKVLGGSFIGFNPADNAAEGAGTSFVAVEHIVTTETVDGATVYTVKKADSYVKDDANKTAVIGTAEGLAAFAADVNSGNNMAGWTVTLISDIDLKNEIWTPIGKGSTNSFQGIFDGQNHTIYNLNARTTSGWYCGLFGYVKGNAEASVLPAVKNFTIENATVIGGNSSAIVVGEVFCANVENVTVKGDVTVSGEAYLGGIVGKGYANVTNCHILANEGGSITSSSSYLGGIIGHRGEGASYDINGCTVKNVTITGSSIVGGIAGISQTGNKITNCVLENVTIVYKNVGDPADQSGVGAISGWATNNVAITGCAFTGTIETPYTLYNDMVTGLGYNGAAQSGLVLENNTVKATVVAE